VIAKACVGADSFQPLDMIDGQLDDEVAIYGTDQEVVALSLSRDLLAMGDIVAAALTKMGAGQGKRPAAGRHLRQTIRSSRS
jgi:hypothetical protein